MEVLKEKGVPEHRILFLNLIASPSGVAEFAERFPKLRVVTAFIDQGLDEKKYNSLSHFLLLLFISKANHTDQLADTLFLVLEILVIVITLCNAISSQLIR